MRYAAYLLLLITLSGCVRAKARVNGEWYREKPHPTREEILQAAKLESPINIEPAKLSITTNPRLMVPGYPLRITCHLPRVEEGKYVFEVANLFKDSGDIGRRMLTKVITAPCSTLQVTCGYSEYKSPEGYQAPKSITTELIPAIECQ